MATDQVALDPFPDPIQVFSLLTVEAVGDISWKWIAKRLVMGSWTNVSNLLGVEKAKTGTHFTK